MKLTTRIWLGISLLYRISLDVFKMHVLAVAERFGGSVIVQWSTSHACNGFRVVIFICCAVYSLWQSPASLVSVLGVKAFMTGGDSTADTHSSLQ